MSESLPHSREMEGAAIGAVLINPDGYHDAAPLVEAEDFFIHRNRYIWEAFGSLNDKRIPVDTVTVADELERRGRLEEVGGPSYLTTLINAAPMSLNLEAYVKTVSGYALRRKMIQAASAAVKLATDETNDLEQALNETHAEFDRITPTYRSTLLPAR